MNHLEYTSTIWCTPSIEKVILPCADKPLPTVRKFEGQDAALVKVKLVLVWLGMVQYFNVTALHPGKQKVVKTKMECNQTKNPKNSAITELQRYK